MKRTSFVCFGARGAKDALVYQEIPGRDGGEEFFLFLSPGRPEQEPTLRGLFREAVSASRLGAPAHYFTRFFEQFAAVAAGGGERNMLEDVLLMIVIRRGNDVHLLCNRDAALVHCDVRTGLRDSARSLKGFSEVPLGGGDDQRDLFRRAPEDQLALYRFAIGDGEHTIILAPSDEFVARHDESLRNSVFFPSFEFPLDAGIEIAVSRSFPALHWSGGKVEDPAQERSRRPRVPRRVNPPLVAGSVAAAVVLAVFVGGSIVNRSRERAPEESNALLAAADQARMDSIATPAGGASPAARGEEPRDAGRSERLDLNEAWKRAFADAVTSSARHHRGTVYFGCRDGYLYAFTPEGELAWKFKARAGIGASPCCVNDRVIGADYRGTVFCLEADTGKTIWTFGTRAKIVSTPDCAGDLVCAATTDGRLFAVRLADGRKVWEKKLGASIRGNVTAGKDYVVAITTDGALYRIDRRGAIVWKASIGADVASSPACDERRDLVVCGAKDRGVHAFSLASGARKWRFEADAAVDGSASCGKDAIYVGSRNGTLYALTIQGTLRWKSGVGGVVHSKPLVEGSLVFVTTYAAELIAVDAASGERAGAYRAGSAIYSSPETDGKYLFFGSNGGVFHAIKLDASAAS